MSASFSIFLLLSSSSLALDTADTIRVFRTLSPFGMQESISGARLIPEKNISVVDLSFCLRFNYRKPKPLFVIEDWRTDGDDWDKVFSLTWLATWYPLTFLGFGYPRTQGSYKSWVMRDPDYPDYSWAFNRWCHVCMAYEQKIGSFRVVMDGKVTNINSEDPEFTKVKIPPDFLSRVFLARCNADWDWCAAPAGQLVSDLNMWSKALTIKEMQDWTTCNSMVKGDVVNWTMAKFQLANMTVDVMPTSALCTAPRPGHVFFPEARNFSTHVAFCGKMRGVASVVKDNVTQMWMSAQIFNFTATCGWDYWAGWWDEPTEGTFTSVTTGTILTPFMHNPWNLGEPNGDTLENCAVVQSYAGANTWNDNGCQYPVCGFCELETYPDLQIRGLCPATQFDRKYSWTRAMVNNRYSFRGYALSLLYFDSNRTQWRIEVLADKSIYATTNMTEYPLGTNYWRVFGDPCYESNVTDVILNINACNSSEFNCENGHCVAMESRCDGKVDCPDKTDELGCTIFTTDVSYMKEVPPAAPNITTSLKVNISVDLLSILEIKEVENLINLQLNLRLTWMDKRLTMFNLKRDSDLNTLTPAFRNAIWIPEVVFHNTQDKIESLNDEKAFATITKSGASTLSSAYNLHNFHMFSGADNPISISRVYNAEFLCQFDMSTFPFDTQMCSVVMVMKGNTAKFMEMQADVLRYLGPVDLTQYFVKKTEIVAMDDNNNNNNNNIKGIKVDIVFGRRILGTMLTTYLPTILICIVSFSTNHYKAFFFEANVSVNLTCLLVLTTLFISVATSMTKTAYIKMIDVWFIFSLCIPFAEVLLHTYIDTLREDEREINHHGRKKVTVNGSDNNSNSNNYSNNNSNNTRHNSKNNRNSNASNPIKNMKSPKGPNLMPQVNYSTDLVSRYDEVEVDARKKLYEKIAKANRNELKINVTMRLVSQGLPASFILFIIAYFGVGYYCYYHG